MRPNIRAPTYALVNIINGLYSLWEDIPIKRILKRSCRALRRPSKCPVNCCTSPSDRRISLWLFLIFLWLALSSRSWTLSERLQLPRYYATSVSYWNLFVPASQYPLSAANINRDNRLLELFEWTSLTAVRRQVFFIRSNLVTGQDKLHQHIAWSVVHRSESFHWTVLLKLNHQIDYRSETKPVTVVKYWI